MSQTNAHKRAKIGYDYVHSAIDDHSRLAYSEILPDEKGPTCAGFLQRAVEHFRANGLEHIERIMTDNAWAYRWSLREVVATLGARQIFIRPHCPWQNGKAERFNRTLQSEWAYHEVFETNDARCAALAPWLVLQQSTTPLSHRRQTPDQPTVTNLTAGRYT
jgi:transposase InsO family protein